MKGVVFFMITWSLVAAVPRNRQSQDVNQLQAKGHDVPKDVFVNSREIPEKRFQVLKKSYALHFPDQGVTDYANIWGMPSLTQFTVCFWMNSSATNKGTPFSYTVPEEISELTIFNYNDFSLYIGGEYMMAHESANDGRWHHICVLWRNSDGVWEFFKDGELHTHTRGLQVGHTIKGGGSLVLGQDQYSLGGGFITSESFQGSLTNVNVWSRFLSARTIKAMSKSCQAGVGDVYQWSDFIYGVKGKAAVVIPSPCHPSS